MCVFFSSWEFFFYIIVIRCSISGEERALNEAWDPGWREQETVQESYELDHPKLPVELAKAVEEGYTQTGGSTTLPGGNTALPRTLC